MSFVRGAKYGISLGVKSAAFSTKLMKGEKACFEKLAGKSHLQPNSSIKDKIFKAFRNYFNK